MGRRKREECPVDLDCHFCTDHRRKIECGKEECPLLPESIEEKTVTYSEAALKLLYRHKNLRPRLGKAVKRYEGPWTNIGHQPRLETARRMTMCAGEVNKPHYYAAIYLLTSSFELFHRILGCFQRDGLHLNLAELRDIAPHDYALYRAAKDIYGGYIPQVISDMADQEKVDDAAFDLIVTALMVSKYGPAVLRLDP